MGVTFFEILEGLELCQWGEKEERANGSCVICCVIRREMLVESCESEYNCVKRGRIGGGLSEAKCGTHGWRISLTKSHKNCEKNMYCVRMFVIAMNV